MNIRQLTRLFMLTVMLLWSVNGLATGQFTGPNRDDNGNIMPSPKGDSCVEPTADMRANHMNYLLHKRDQTMHQGIRTKKHSLTECINCHATPGKDGKIARVSTDQHFCSSCHRVTSVKLDCFECHADRPVESFSLAPTTNPVVSPVVLDLSDSLSDFLQASNSHKPHVAPSNTLQ